MPENLITTCRDAITRHQMLPESGAVVVAVSGGPDSMALLECLCTVLGDGAQGRLVVAHLNHMLRPEAVSDAEFVEEEAKRHSLRVALGTQDVRRIARVSKLSVEDAARRTRYAFLLKTAVEHGASVVAVGHNADDQAETVLLRAVRGTGIRGLSAMRPVRSGEPPYEKIAVIRPLLDATRDQIEDFLERRGTPCRRDHSNVDPRYRRNLVRHRIMPVIRDSLQPRLVEVLCRLARNAAQATDYLGRQAASLVKTARPGAPVVIGLEALREAHPALRGAALASAFERATAGMALSSAHLGLIGSMIEGEGEGGGRVQLPGGWRAEVKGSDLVIESSSRAEAAGAPEPWSVTIPVPGDATLPDGRRLAVSVEDLRAGEQPPRTRNDGETGDEWLDYDAAGRPSALVARSKLPGDRFTPLGAPGRRTVKRFLIDARVARERRHRVAVVAVPSGPILWVAPHRIDHAMRVTDATSRILVLALH